MSSYFLDYVNSNPIVGNRMQRLFKVLMEDLKRDEYIYDTKDADLRIKFIETFCKCTKAPFYGRPIVLQLWQKAFIEVFYSFKKKDGHDRFKKTLLVIARKNGKTELVISLLFAELMLGAGGNDIVCSSNNDMQANILYDGIDTMRKLFDPDNKRTRRTVSFIENKKTGSKVFKLNQSTKNKEGRNIDYACIDEMNEMRTNDIIKAIEQSQSVKPNPKLFMITTEGFVNNGPLDTFLDYSDKVLDGVATDDSFLPWLYIQDSEREVWQNPSSWVKSNPSLDVVKQRDYLQQQLDTSKDIKSERAYVLCKDFNLKQLSNSAWLEDFSYLQENCDVETLANKICIASVDLSETTDLTALTIMYTKHENKKKYFYTHYFIPEQKLVNSLDISAGARYKEWIEDGYITVQDGATLDMEKIADYLINIIQTYNVKIYKVGYDQRFAKPFIDRIEDCGIETEVVYQNANTMSLPINITEADFKAHNIQYGNNPVTEWCLSNVCVNVNSLGQAMCFKPQGSKGKRIDGAIAMIIANAIYIRNCGEYKMYARDN